MPSAGADLPQLPGEELRGARFRRTHAGVKSRHICTLGALLTHRSFFASRFPRPCRFFLAAQINGKDSDLTHGDDCEGGEKPRNLWPLPWLERDRSARGALVWSVLCCLRYNPGHLGGVPSHNSQLDDVRKDVRSAVPLFACSLTPSLARRSSVVAGGISGALTWAIVYPVDIIKSIIQTIPLNTPRERRTTLYVAKDIIKRHGRMYLFHGLGVTVLRALPVNGMIFPVYELSMVRS